jgi:hypothetical protein
MQDGLENEESPEKREVSAAPNVLGLIQPTRKSNTTSEAGWLNVNSMEMRMIIGNRKQ